MKYYDRKIYKEIKLESYSEKTNKIENTNIIYNKSSENMEEIPENSIHLIITSPPYNVGKEYDQDLSLNEYFEFLERVFLECKRVLIPGGKLCINIIAIGRKPYIPLHHYLSTLLINNGLYMLGEIIWNKSTSGGGSSSTAWGSWMSPSSPCLREIHESILIFSKGNQSLKGNKEDIDITKEEFLEYTKSIWNIRTENSKSNPHPAPFPEELPSRLIKLYTYKGNIVLDPFMGGGSTSIAAINLNRKYIGYETNPEYCEMIKERIYNLSKKKKLF